MTVRVVAWCNALGGALPRVSSICAPLHCGYNLYGKAAGRMDVLCGSRCADKEGRLSAHVWRKPKLAKVKERLAHGHDQRAHDIEGREKSVDHVMNVVAPVSSE